MTETEQRHDEETEAALHRELRKLKREHMLMLNFVMKLDNGWCHAPMRIIREANTILELLKKQT
jgi:hypothetical protein